MNFVLRRLQLWGVNIQRREMVDFTENLEAMDGDEIGMLVACANHQRVVLRETKGWDLLYPAILCATRPDLPALVAGAIKDLQKQGKQPFAAGLMVWLHTLRSMETLELRKEGRLLWAQLQRGFPHAERSALSLIGLTGVVFRLEGVGLFPDGLEPTPR